MSTELRATLAALPNRRTVMAAMLACRDNPNSLLRPVWALLLAELADVDAEERERFHALADSFTMPIGAPLGEGATLFADEDRPCDTHRNPSETERGPRDTHPRPVSSE